jgi:hypothetical protein
MLLTFHSLTTLICICVARLHFVASETPPTSQSILVAAEQLMCRPDSGVHGLHPGIVLDCQCAFSLSDTSSSACVRMLIPYPLFATGVVLRCCLHVHRNQHVL